VNCRKYKREYKYKSIESSIESIDPYTIDEGKPKPWRHRFRNVYNKGITLNAMIDDFRVTHVQWAANDNHISCPGCLQLHGMLYPVDEALEVETKKHEGCRCTWNPIFADRCTAKPGKIDLSEAPETILQGYRYAFDEAWKNFEDYVPEEENEYIYTPQLFCQRKTT
jgi:hypothetical protein